MTNPVVGGTELAAAQSNPEVPVTFIDRAMARALGGGLTINFTANANLTLTASTPALATDNWSARVLRFTDTGTVLTANRDVTYPDVDTLYGGPSRLEHVFTNATARTLTLKRSGQTGVAAAPGESWLVYHDGTDIRAVRAAPEPLVIAATPLGVAIAATGIKATRRAGYAFTIKAVRGSLGVAAATGTFQFDVRINGTTIFSTLPTFDATEKTTQTAAAAGVISGGAFAVADDAEITVHVLNVASGAAEELTAVLYR